MQIAVQRPAAKKIHNSMIPTSKSSSAIVSRVALHQTGMRHAIALVHEEKHVTSSVYCTMYRRVEWSEITKWELRLTVCGHVMVLQYIFIQTELKN